MSETAAREKDQKGLRQKAETGAILDWLVQDFEELFSRDTRARVALWLDAKSEFVCILQFIAERFESDGISFLALDPSENHGPLWLKWAVELGAAGKRVVLWLPYDRKQVSETSDGPRLDYLLEYTFSGLTWLIDGKPPTLFGNRLASKHRGYTPGTTYASRSLVFHPFRVLPYSRPVLASSWRRFYIRGSCMGRQPRWQNGWRG